MINKRTKLACSLASLVALSTLAYADANNCAMEFAVGKLKESSGLQYNVAFNVSNGKSAHHSITLSTNSKPQIIGGMLCSEEAYTVSATFYPAPAAVGEAKPIGQCHLKAGAIVLGGENNSASVVFPEDFNC